MLRTLMAVEFTAPEVLGARSQAGRGAEYSLSADVYSIGMLLWMLASRERPWHPMRYEEIVSAVKLSQRPPKPCERCPVGWQELMYACWAQNPHSRPSSQACVRRLEAISVHIVRG